MAGTSGRGSGSSSCAPRLRLLVGLWSLGFNTEHRLLLTGTPLQNNLTEHLGSSSVVFGGAPSQVVVADALPHACASTANGCPWRFMGVVHLRLGDVSVLQRLQGLQRFRITAVSEVPSQAMGAVWAGSGMFGHLTCFHRVALMLLVHVGAAEFQKLQVCVPTVVSCIEHAFEDLGS